MATRKAETAQTAFHRRIGTDNLAALWVARRGIDLSRPKSPADPVVWRYGDVRPHLMRLLKTVPILFLLAACASVPAEDPAQPIPKANSEESAPPAKGEAPAKTAPPEARSTKAGPTVAPWKPPVPGSDKFDWVQLKSGEWLKGEIQVMRKESLEFESDELDTLNLDWDDVLEVRSPRNMTVTFTRTLKLLASGLWNQDA